MASNSIKNYGAKGVFVEFVCFLGLIILGFVVAYFNSSTFIKAVNLNSIKDFSIFLAFMAFFIWTTLRFREIKGFA